MPTSTPTSFRLTTVTERTDWKLADIFIRLGSCSPGIKAITASTGPAKDVPNSAKSNRPYQLPALTGVRFFLALWVVCYHQAGPNGAIGPWLTQSPLLLANLVHTGYVAVSVFFVLSGFILAYNYSLETWLSRKQLARFAIARFARIYPVYLLGVLAAVVLFGFQMQRIRSLLMAFGLVQAWDPATALSWNAPGWSLSDEAFFYLCFPFVGVLLWRLRGPLKWIGVMAAIWLLSLLVPVFLTVSGQGYGPASAFGASQPGAPALDHFLMNFSRFNPAVRLPEFCMGILICKCWLFLKETNHFLYNRGSWLYLPSVAVIVGVLLWAGDLPYLPVHNSLLLPFFGCLILGLALQGGTLAAFLSHPWLMFLGQASYAIYILHQPILRFMSTAAGGIFTPRGLPGMSAYLLVVLITASGAFKLVEEPMNKLLKTRLGNWLDRHLPAASPKTLNTDFVPSG